MILKYNLKYVRILLSGILAKVNPGQLGSSQNWTAQEPIMDPAEGNIREPPECI